MVAIRQNKSIKSRLIYTKVAGRYTNDYE